MTSLSNSAYAATYASNNIGHLWGAAAGKISTMSNVGIGTQAPGYKLDVVGDVNASGAMRIGGTAFSGGTSYWGGTASTLSNVGIGATPSVLFHVAGNGYVSGTMNFATSGGLSWGANTSQIYDDGDLRIKTDDTMHFNIGGAERLTINSSGNVGVNNGSPGYKLDVAGNVNCSSWLRTDGQTGFYCQSWGGGWFMTGTTMLSCYGDKIVYSAGGFLGGMINCTGGTGTFSGLVTLNGTTNYTWAYYYVSAAGGHGYNSSGTGAYGLTCAARFAGSELDVVSDERAKDEINDFDGTICRDILRNIRHKHYRMKDDGTYKVGFIAQQVEEVFPNAVSKMPRGDIPDFRVLNYDQMLSVLWGAVRQVQSDSASADAIESENDRLEAEIESYERALAAIEARLTLAGL